MEIKSIALSLLLLTGIQSHAQPVFQPIITLYYVVDVPTNAPYCELPYLYREFRNETDTDASSSSCRIYGLETVQFTSDTNYVYHVQRKNQTLVPNAPDNCECGWINISPPLQGTGDIITYQWGVPSAVGFIRIKATQ